jgi:hypothetical protein
MLCQRHSTVYPIENFFYCTNFALFSTINEFTGDQAKSFCYLAARSLRFPVQDANTVMLLPLLGAQPTWPPYCWPRPGRK